jgi:hypothetical protein
MHGLAALPAHRRCTQTIKSSPMEVFWVVVVLWAGPGETHEMYGARGHYPTKEACLVAAGEEALKFVHQMYVATRCEARLGPAVPHGPPKAIVPPARKITCPDRDIFDSAVVRCVGP